MTGSAHRASGFTFVELLAVVAIIGILAAIAVPQYSTYLDRAKLAEALVLADPARKAVADFYARWGRFPGDNRAAGLAPPRAYAGLYVDAIEVDDGAIHVLLTADRSGRRIGDKLAGQTISLRPAVKADYPTGPVSWVCMQAAVPAGWNAQGSARKHSLPASILPPGCK